MNTKTRTQQLAWSRKFAFGHVHLDDVKGRRAIFRTFDGTKMIGTVTGLDRLGQYLVVTFPDGRWARLDDTVTLVREEV